MKPALAYFRTSSATNVGADKDSLVRQQTAVRAYALANAIDIVGEYYDAAVSGADPLDARPGFRDLLAHIASNGVRTVLLETASRFARDLMVQEAGHARLKELGVELVAVDSPDAFLDDGPTAVLIRQILGAVAQFDKALTVAKLRGARERKRARDGKCEGRKSHAETNPEMAAFARQMRSQGFSLAAIARALAEKGCLSKSGQPLIKSVVARLCQ